MSARAADVLELLLPEARGERQVTARRTVTFLRLLSHSASPRRATSVRLALAGARDELEQAQRERLAAALRDLVAHHLAAARPPECFLDLGTPRRSHDRAWMLLGEERAEVAGLPHVPSPGEEPLAVAARLIACAERLGLAPDEVPLWRARHTRLAAGGRAGERAFLDLLDADGGCDGRRGKALALAGALGCLLDRGAVLQAASLLEERSALAEGSASLARIAGWVRLLAGGGRAAGEQAADEQAIDEQAIDEQAMGPQGRPPRLPAPLVELRRDLPEWLRYLPGVAARGRAPRSERVAARGELGAAALAVFALEPAGAARVVHLDCAPALRGVLPAWLEGRDGACRRPGELEREMVARAEVVVAHRRDGAPPRGCLDPGAIRSVALAPVCDRAGELHGWLRLECEHHLLPSRARLRALARAWREDVRPLPASAAREPPLELEVAAAGPLPDPRAQVLGKLVDSLGAKLAQRRWWGVVVDGTRPRLVAEGGGALEDWRRRPGGARALRRALVAACSVRFDQPDARVSLAAEAASGVVVPVVHRGRTLALLCLESTRRRDVEALQRGLENAAQAGALEVRVACFRAWHQARWGHDVLLDVGVAATGALAEDLVAAAAVHGAATLSGPAGSGKRVLARWLHHESRRTDGPLLVHACGSHDTATEERELLGSGLEPGSLLQRARGGTLVLDDPERLGPLLQARLEGWLAEGGRLRAGRADHADPEGSPRLVLSVRAPLATLQASGKLREDLAQRLQRLELHVPGLAERREEIPGLTRALAQRFAHEVGQPAPELDDEALALLWRQPWHGNVRELENVVYRLVLCGGARVGAAHVEQVARRLRLELTRRMPPRTASPQLLAAALRTTRTLRGTPNKTRAALYLGWDPDTLARRLTRAGLAAAQLLQ